MANDDHIAQLMKGVPAWNAWRRENSDIWADFTGADLSVANLNGANLSGARLMKANLKWAQLEGANLSRADLREVDLFEANLNGANLEGANLEKAVLWFAKFERVNLNGALLKVNLNGALLNLADLSWAELAGADLSGAALKGARLDVANFSGANLSRADLKWARLHGANLSGADLSGANLETSTLVQTDLTGADLTGCRVYGVSAWDLKLERTKQQNLVITRKQEPEITVDNIEVAQFIYLLLHNQKIRDVIDTITSKAVLILGRFTDDRKAVLDALREELRNRNLLPILFDFPPSGSLDVTETIKVLAGLARFVIADITDAREVPVELHNIVRDFTSLPIQPILLRGHDPFVSLSHLKKLPWVLPTFEYDEEHLLASLDKSIISPAEDAARKLRS